MPTNRRSLPLREVARSSGGVCLDCFVSFDCGVCTLAKHGKMYCEICGVLACGDCVESMAWCSKCDKDDEDIHP
jgi:hypothetical protein